MTSTEILASVHQKPSGSSSLQLATWLHKNPILLKEMRSRMRGWRSLVGVTGFICLLSVVVTLIYFSVSPTGQPIQILDQRAVGRAIFFSVYGIELMMICLTAPAVTAGAISTEKEQQTYDLLRTTLLTAQNLVLGKLIAAISYILLLMVAAIPIQFFAFLFGGITLGEVLVSVLIMILSALLFGTLGIFYSTLISKTRVATGAAQFTTVAVVIIIPITTLVAVLALQNKLNMGQLSDLEQLLFFGTMWLVCITSPASTALFTEVFLEEKQTLFFVTETLNSGALVYIPSPWLGFVILYPLLTIFLLIFAIRMVKKADR